MILEHFNSEAMRPPQDFDQPAPTCYGKPRGLWVSVRGEDDWVSWCQAEGFNVPDGFQHRTLVHLVPEAQILWVTSVEEIDAFDAKYSVPDPDLTRGLGQLADRYSSVLPFLDGIVMLLPPLPPAYGRRVDRFKSSNSPSSPNTPTGAVPGIIPAALCA